QPGAPLANLAAVPIAAVLVPFAAVLALLGGALSWLTAPLAAVGAAALRTTVGLAADLPGATIETGPPPLALLVLSVASLFAAGGHAPDIGRWTIVPALRALGVRRLDAVFVSHQDADHCGAVGDLLPAMRVGEVCVSAGFGTDAEPRALVARCRARAVPVTV